MARPVWFSLCLPKYRKPGIQLKNRLGLRAAEVDWSRVVKALSEPQTYGTKDLDAPHWFAGQMDPDAAEAGYIAMGSREFLVLDHDIGTLTMETASMVLDSEGLEHLIIPSSSWQPGFHRFHVILPLRDPVPMSAPHGVERWHAVIDQEVYPWLDQAFQEWGGQRAWDNPKNGVRRYFCYNTLARDRGGMPIHGSGSWFLVDWAGSLERQRSRRQRPETGVGSLREAIKGYDPGAQVVALLRAPEGQRIRAAIFSYLCREVLGVQEHEHSRPGNGGPVFHKLPCPECKKASCWTPTAVEHRPPLVLCNHREHCGYAQEVDRYLREVSTTLERGDRITTMLENLKKDLQRRTR